MLLFPLFFFLKKEEEEEEEEEDKEEEQEEEEEDEEEEEKEEEEEREGEEGEQGEESCYKYPAHKSQPGLQTSYRLQTNKFAEKIRRGLEPRPNLWRKQHSLSPSIT